MGLLTHAVRAGSAEKFLKLPDAALGTLALIPDDPEWNALQIWKLMTEGEKVVDWQMCRHAVKDAGAHIVSYIKPDKIIRGLCAGYDAMVEVEPRTYYEILADNASRGCGGVKSVATKGGAAAWNGVVGGASGVGSLVCRGGNAFTGACYNSCICLLDSASWAGRRIVNTAGVCIAIGVVAGVGYLLFKWRWAIDRRAQARLRGCGPTIREWIDGHDSGSCLYCRGASQIRHSKHMKQFDVPMMRCWGCWHKPARYQIWLHASAFDRGMSIINRHRVKGDWTAGSEMQATHGAILREIPDSLTCKTRHSEVVLLVAAMNATTNFVEPLSRIDDADGDASLIEPSGSVPKTDSGDGGDDDEQPPPSPQVRASPRPAATPAVEGAGLCLHDDEAQRTTCGRCGSTCIRTDHVGHEMDCECCLGSDWSRTDQATSSNPFRIGAGLQRTEDTQTFKVRIPPGFDDLSPQPEVVPVPFGALGRGYASVAEVKSLPAHVHLKRTDHPGAGRERQIVQQSVELECYNAVKDDGGLDAGSLLLHEKTTNPQFMVIGSRVAEEELPYVAGSGPDIEEAAIANRHFAEKRNEFGGLTGVVQESAIPAIDGACASVLKLLLSAGRVAKEFQDYPEDYDVNSKDAADSLHKKSTLLADFEYFAFIPSSWGKERGKAGLSKLANTQEEVKQKHTFFVKLNEALRKIKPRLIQASGDDGCMAHTFDAGFFETIMFGITMLERRSVKHAGPEHLRARLAGLLKPFMEGFAISFDYGAFDSSNCIHKDDPRHSLKELIENKILKAMFGDDAEMSDQTRHALEDRCKKFLRSKSAFWLLYTKTYGRESGDRGTSCLNFLVNLVLWLAIMGMESAYRKTCEKHPSAKEPTDGEHPWINAFVQGMEYDGEIVDRFLRGEPCGFELVAEGDDGLWLFTSKFAAASPGGMSAMADRFHYWSCMQGTNLEPQDETGEAKGEARVQRVQRRMEHCSRIIVPYWTDVTERQKQVPAKKGAARSASEDSKEAAVSKPRRVLRVALLPKMRKTIEAADITFGLAPGVELAEQTKMNIAFTKFASCAFNSIDDPLLFNYFFMHARVMLLGDGDPDLDKRHEKHMKARFEYSAKNYVHKNMVNAMAGKTATIDEDTLTEFPIGPMRLLKMLWQRHERAIATDGHCEAMMKAVKIESPDMDDDFILAAISGMKQTGTWVQCGEWAGLVKARLGRV